jgi:hypothetical protein
MDFIEKVPRKIKNPPAGEFLAVGRGTLAKI